MTFNYSYLADPKGGTYSLYEFDRTAAVGQAGDEVCKGITGGPHDGERSDPRHAPSPLARPPP